MKLFAIARIEYSTAQCGLVATDVVQEASEALAESREQPTPTPRQGYELDDSGERAVAREQLF